MFTLNPNAQSTAINAEDIQGMITHWLNTPVNGYLGSDLSQAIKRPHDQKLPHETRHDTRAK